MILVTLILGLEFVTRVSASPSGQAAEQPERTAKTIADLKREIEKVEAKINSARVSAADLPSLDATQLKVEADELVAESDAMERELSAAKAQASEDQRKLQDAKTSAAQDSKVIDAERKALEDRIAKEEEDLRRIEDGTRILFRSGIHGKHTWLIEITSEGYRLGEIGVKEPPKTMTISALNDWAKSLDPSSNAFLLIVKPGGKAAYLRCRSLLADEQRGNYGFDVGMQVVAADQDVLDPETGAGSR
jgi:hypothetical protein